MEQILFFIKPILEAYSGNLGGALQAITIIGSLRLAIKPIMALIQTYVLITPSKGDDILPAKIMDNKVYKTVVFLLDWIASLKLPKK